MSDLVQKHIMQNSREAITITRTKQHKYQWSIGENTSNWLPSVTTIGSYVGGDTFGVAVNWAVKLIRESDGNLKAPNAATKQGQDEGNQLHDEIDQFIKYSAMPPETHHLFTAWHKAVGKQDGRAWVASEQMVVDTQLEIGGTLDAISVEKDGAFAIWDWKTKTDSYRKYGGYPKERAQIAAYARALQRMDHKFAPDRAYICYIIRDDSGDVFVEEVDIDSGEELFATGLAMYKLIEEGA